MKKLLSVIISAAIMLSALMVPSAVMAAGELTTPDENGVYYMEDFSASTGITNVLYPDFSKAELNYSVGGESVLKITDIAANANAGSTYFFRKVDNRSKETVPEMVYEMRVKMNPKTSYAQISSLSGFYDATYGRYGMTSAWIGGSAYVDKVYTKNAENIITVISSEEHKNTEFHTYTYVYDPADSSRDIYLDGVLVSENQPELSKSNTNPVAKYFAPNISYYSPHTPGTEIEVDYVKVYEIKENASMKADIEGKDSVSTKGITVSFNNPPVNISADKFSFSDGTGISSVEYVNETTYKVIPANELAAAKSYTLNINGVCDGIGRSCTEAIEITTKTASYTEEETWAYQTFGADALAPTTTNTNWKSEITTTDDNTSVWKVTRNPGDNNTIIYTANLPVVNKSSLATVPDAVYEYRVRLDMGSRRGYTDGIGEEWAYGAMPSAGIWLDYSTSVAYLTPGIHKGYHRNQYLTPFPEGSWATVSVLYSGTEEKREIYLNGELMGTVSAVEGSINDEGGFIANYWKNKKYLWGYISVGFGNGGYMEMDYMKMYAPATSFDAKVVSDTETDPEGIQIKFNTRPLSVAATQVKVNGVMAKNVILTDEANNIYTVVPGAPLKGNTEYEIALNGIKSPLGKVLTESYSFTTKAMPEYEVAFNVTGNGTVEVDGAAVTTVNVPHAEKLTFKAVPSENHHVASVTAGETELKPSADNLYTMDCVTEAMNISVVFEENPESDPALAGFNYYLPEEKTYSVTFGKIIPGYKTAVDSYGIIYSATNEAPVMDGEGCVTFEATEKVKATGEYGIFLVHMGKLGSKYYTRPYMCFTNSEGQQIVYGDVKTVVLD